MPPLLFLGRRKSCICITRSSVACTSNTRKKTPFQVHGPTTCERHWDGAELLAGSSAARRRACATARTSALARTMPGSLWGLGQQRACTHLWAHMGERRPEALAGVVWVAHGEVSGDEV